MRKALLVDKAKEEKLKPIKSTQMGDPLLEKLALGKQITDEEIASALFEICNRLHPNCGRGCPVFRLNCNQVVFGTDRYVKYGCECYKTGSKMLAFMRSKGVSDFTF